MKSKYPKIFEPITIKRMTIKNRVAMTPMGTNYGETSGEMSNRHMNYYSLRAKGGTGLIILENANIEYPVGSNGTSQIRIDHDSFMPRYYQLVENLHKNGAMVAIQVNHAGASASSARTGMETVSSSNIPTKAGGEIPRPMTKEEILNAIGNAGVVGMGGAGFPTRVKLSPKEPDKIDYIIANCAECEPYITADYRTMIETPEKLVEGMKIVLRLFDNAKGIFGVEDNKPDCIAKLKELTAGDPRLEVLALKTKYPQGGERQLIYATTGRAINSAMLPADAGCVVDNVATLVSIYQAVAEGKPSMERVVTVSGDAVNEPGNFRVPFGMNQAELVEAAGGFKTEPEKLISGGPMMGFAMFSLDVPVTKTSSSILGFTKDEVAKFEPTACINCGRCVDACPSRLIPSRLADYAEHHDEETFTKHNGLECMECGSCSFVCPAKRQLKQAIGSMRKIALANRKKKK